MEVKLVLAVLVALGVASCSDASRLPNTKANHWALLVAGSNGYYNYRHQADIAHAYQIMKRNGIPEDHIIVMMYDDVANSNQNPVKGTLINHPNGQDVYHGVVKDYVGKDVTPENFLKVLFGDAAGMKGIGSGKVVASGPEDHVFVNFADHGGPGIIAFPDGLLHVAQLNKTIWQMYEKKHYHKMVMYIEACESGSMFQQTLPPDINVFATTASNATTSSYACYYDEMRHTYLGDLYSVKWMEDSDLGLLGAETLIDQFHTVKAEVNMSTVCMFGDAEIGSHYFVGEFQGTEVVMSPAPGASGLPKPAFDAVPAPDVPLHIARKNYELAKTEDEKMDALSTYGRLTYMRQFTDEVTERIVDEVAKTNDIVKSAVLEDKVLLRTAHGCYQPIVDAFHNTCFHLGRNSYALRKLQVFVNLCESEIKQKVILDSLAYVCRKGPWEGAN